MHGNTLVFLVSKSIKLVLMISFLENNFNFICTLIKSKLLILLMQTPLRL